MPCVQALKCLPKLNRRYAAKILPRVKRRRGDDYSASESVTRRRFYCEFRLARGKDSSASVSLIIGLTPAAEAAQQGVSGGVQFFDSEQPRAGVEGQRPQAHRH